ncbi:uncharacterized protein E0L32_003697 [Thyridium curvatum]|uniref:Large ribosomal subunit protein mL54 n=1 Tax=Thyridium curvatum TaxID=1093900 RepID=A0A507BBZ6_9PEZI|nr:uncharacterized protein E0L32_003697 [Thyridium curvatum]TPX16756.1 hypothetical protein E0L32_003697 [Thyridium curvatum]
MICRPCLRRMTAIRPAAQLALRPFSVSAPWREPAAAAAQDATASDPLAPATTAPSDGGSAKAPLSSCPKGTVLSGLNYFKGKQDPVARADEEYPEWLWQCLDVQKKAAEEADADAGDEFSKSRKQRRLAAKRQRQLEAKLLASGDIEALAPKIPLQQQSINLPGGENNSVENAVFAADKREELRKAMRKERKSKIKETNYLKSM